MTAAERIAWIDIAKGLCIVAVVSMYANDRVMELPGVGNWMAPWVKFARPFRIPDFFLISGLFLSRVIDRPWRGYLDKKAVHYLYFFGLWTLIYFPYLVVTGEAGGTPGEAAAHLLKILCAPYAMLWFIQMLAIYFTITRLLRGVPVWAMVLLAVLWQMFPLGTSLRQLERFGERYIYFYAGYAFAPFFFRLAEWARRRPPAALLGLAAWAGFNGLLVYRGGAALPGVGAALGLMGACAVITAASLLSGLRFMGWLGYLGERSIAIYLSFLLPMTAMLAAVSRLGWFTDRGTLAAALTALSVLGALVLDRLTKGTFLSFLFERPRWARLREASDQSASRAGPPAELSAST